MIGLEFNPSHPKVSGSSSKVVAAGVDNGLLLLTAGMYESIRFIPPLNVSKEEINLALGLFQSTLKSVFPDLV